jgi:uncharacterized membrane protein
MPQISTVKNALQTVVKKDRLLNAVFAGGKSFIVSISHTFYALWLQTTGLMYVFFTGAGIVYLIHEYHKNHFANRLHFWIPSLFTLICFVFTVQSFTKAKRTSKRK